MTIILELRDRCIADNGDVIVKPDLLKRLVEQPADKRAVLNHVKTFECPMVNTYNKVRKDKNLKPIDIYVETDREPAPETYEWQIPQEYKNMDITEITCAALLRKELHDETYVNRLETELNLIYERNMTGFIQALLYIRDQFRKNDIVWGVGRGSSCASLVMFLLDINKVDPVKYDIPLEEFFK